jgi:hypothetical protein
MTNQRKIATALFLAALSMSSIATAEPKGLVGNFGRHAAQAQPAPVRTAQCDCRMMTGDAAMQAPCMGMAGAHGVGGSKPPSAG